MVKLSTPIKEAVSLMVQFRVHRFAVLSDDYGTICIPFHPHSPPSNLFLFACAAGSTAEPIPYSAISSVVTQSDIFSLVVSHVFSLESAASLDKSIGDLKVNIPTVVSCSHTDMTSEAFTKMQASGVYLFLFWVPLVSCFSWILFKCL